MFAGDWRAAALRVVRLQFVVLWWVVGVELFGKRSEGVALLVGSRDQIRLGRRGRRDSGATAGEGSGEETREQGTMSEQITVKLPDGSSREYAPGTTPADVAA